MTQIAADVLWLEHSVVDRARNPTRVSIRADYFVKVSIYLDSTIS